MDRNRLHPPVADLRNKCGQARCQVDEMLVALNLPDLELGEIQCAMNRVLEQVIADLAADILRHLALRLNC